jgi:hypothetical protein
MHGDTEEKRMAVAMARTLADHAYGVEEAMRRIFPEWKRTTQQSTRSKTRSSG